MSNREKRSNRISTRNCYACFRSESLKFSYPQFKLQRLCFVNSYLFCFDTEYNSICNISRLLGKRHLSNSEFSAKVVPMQKGVCTAVAVNGLLSALLSALYAVCTQM